jgi:ubiquinone/menaquinone biosynthesis C-methylase UbiE
LESFDKNRRMPPGTRRDTTAEDSMTTTATHTAPTAPGPASLPARVVAPTAPAPRVSPETVAAPAQPAVADQAPVVLSQVAGYVGHRTILMGLRQGLIAALADAPAGLTPDELAGGLGFDAFYVAVWARAATAAGVCDVTDGRYRLAPHMATLLLDTSSPAYAGGLFSVLAAPEMFDRLEQNLATGERSWWEHLSHDFIAGVATTGTPFYNRLVPAGLKAVPGLEERLAAGARIVDTACGAGVGLLRLLQAYPASTVVGVDGDAHSLELARERLTAAGVLDRVELVHSPLEDFTLDTPATLVINNISMHECRDADQVTERVRQALEPGGWFVISDFPFPEDVAALRSVPGRIMSGIQVFEAQIDDQLLPRSTYDDLLTRHAFNDLGSIQLAPVHALTWGRR